MQNFYNLYTVLRSELNTGIPFGPAIYQYTVLIYKMSLLHMEILFLFCQTFSTKPCIYANFDVLVSTAQIDFISSLLFKFLSLLNKSIRLCTQ